MEFHKKALENLCRLCARKSAKKRQQRPAKDCMANKSKILEFYEIKVDDSPFAPSKFCLKCYRRIINSKNPEVRSSADVDQKEKERIQRINQIWKAHQDTDCKICQIYEVECKGGDTVFSTKAVNQILENLPCAQDMQLCLDSPPFEANLASAILNTPVSREVPAISTAHTPTTCTSSESTHQNELPLENSPSSNLLITTPKQTKKFAETTTQTTPKQLLQDSLKRNLTSPLNKDEEKVMTHNVRRKLKGSSDGKTVSCKTGGRVSC